MSPESAAVAVVVVAAAAVGRASPVGHRPSATSAAVRPPTTGKLRLMKRTARDEFMAAAVGDMEWLQQAIRSKPDGSSQGGGGGGAAITFDKDVSRVTI